MLVGKIKSAYHHYVYYSPIPVLSKEETIILNTINIILLTVGIYWIVHILPELLIHTFEKLYYYLTGNSISIGLLLTALVSKDFWSGISL